MSVANLLQYAVFVIVVAVLVKPLGGYMARIFRGEKTLFDPVLRPEQLVRKRPRKWESQASDAWRHIIEMLNARPRLHLEECTRALQFCFEHPEAALAPVVATAFFPVHAAALQERASTLWGMFAFLEWDRGLELRRRLVDAFCRGSWPPEYFVVAAREPWLLRKLCKRMLRQWHGNQLLQRAYDTLTSHDTVGQSHLIDTLRDVLQDPDVNEDWD